MTRIATYNLLHGADLVAGGRVDLTTAAASVSALDAEVVAVQEVDRYLPRSGEVDQVARLCELLGPDWGGVFAPALLGDPESAWTALHGDDPGGPAFGVGIVTRHPVVTAWRMRLPGGGDGRRRSMPQSSSRPGWDREPRVALRVHVDLAGGRPAGGREPPLQITTTHLSYLPWRGVAQLRRAGRWASAGGPAVLAGDLNLPPGVVRRVLPGWRHAGGEPTYPTWEPRMQVDQILLRGWRARTVDVVPTTSSDHLPLVADVVPA